MRNLWKSKNWSQYISFECRTGIRLHFEKGVDSNFRSRCIDFVKWLRSEYDFPIRINIYIKRAEYIRTYYGEIGNAWFAGSYGKCKEPYIIMSAGDWEDALHEYEGNEEHAVIDYLILLIHELTHYYQWIKDIFTEENEIKNDRQARYYSKVILEDYLAYKNQLKIRDTEM